MTVATQIALIGVVTLAAWTDLRSRKIPNWITVTGSALGFVLQSWNAGLSGTAAAFMGAVFGLAIFIVLYIAGGMGAGDVKLFGAVGALVGPSALVIVFVFTGLLGGVVALGVAGYRGR